MTRSVLKVRCPACKGQTWLSAEAFGKLRSQLSAAVEHVCEHCGHQFATTLAGPTSVPPSPPPPLPPSAAVYQKPVEPLPPPPSAPPPASVPFAPKAAAPGGAPPFGLLGERREDNPAQGRIEPKPGSPPPFAAGPSHSPSGAEKKSLGEWWKSQSPGKQWTMLICVLITIGAVFIILPDAGEPAPSTKKPKGPAKEKVDPNKSKSSDGKESQAKDSEANRASEASKASEAGKTSAKKAPEDVDSVEKTPTSKSPEIKSPEAVSSASSIDEAMGLLCQESDSVGGKIETPLAAVWAVDSKGFIVRGAKAFADWHAAKYSTGRWFVATPAKRYQVSGIRFHPEFPVDKLKALAAKGSQPDILKLLASAERTDVALIETTPTPTASLTLAKDLSAIVGKPRHIATPTDPKPSTPGKPIAVKFARRPLVAEMFKNGGGGLAFKMAPGVDAVVTTNDGLLAALVPRNADNTDVHPIITAETLKELLAAR
jgi:hypothetical protein